MNSKDARYRAAFYGSSIPQVLLNSGGYILEANERFFDLVQIVGLTSGSDRISDYLDGSVQVTDLVRADLDNYSWPEPLHVRGTSRWVTLNLIGVREGKEVQHLVAQLQDITENKQLKEDLQQNSEDIEQFAYIASHDLREPLMAVAGFATLLKRRCDTLDDKSSHFLDQIIDGAKQMERKIDDLLTFSRAGRLVDQSPFPLGMAIEEAKRCVCQRIEETGAVIVIKGDLPIVWGNRGMIAQVFQNLFSNSIKYRKHLERPIIEVWAERDEEGYWVIGVKDNGIGFNMEYKDHIFGVFQRLHTIEQYPGTGIGLAIVKKIIERHKGVVWPESELGQGTTFFFTLPSVPKHRTDA